MLASMEDDVSSPHHGDYSSASNQSTASTPFPVSMASQIRLTAPTSSSTTSTSSATAPPVPSSTDTQNPSGPTFQCSYVNCRRIFQRKTALTNHLKAHKNIRSRSIRRTRRQREREVEAAMRAEASRQAEATSLQIRATNNSTFPVSPEFSSRFNVPPFDTHGQQANVSQSQYLPQLSIPANSQTTINPSSITTNDSGVHHAMALNQSFSSNPLYTIYDRRTVPEAISNGQDSVLENEHIRNYHTHLVYYPQQERNDDRSAGFAPRLMPNSEEPSNVLTDVTSAAMNGADHQPVVQSNQCSYEYTEQPLAHTQQSVPQTVSASIYSTKTTDDRNSDIYVRSDAPTTIQYNPVLPPITSVKRERPVDTNDAIASSCVHAREGNPISAHEQMDPVYIVRPTSLDAAVEEIEVPATIPPHGPYLISKGSGSWTIDDRRFVRLTSTDSGIERALSFCMSTPLTAFPGASRTVSGENTEANQN